MNPENENAARQLDQRMTADEAFQDYIRRMTEDVRPQVQATGSYDFENDWYKIHYNACDGQIHVEYKGPLETAPDR